MLTSGDVAFEWFCLSGIVHFQLEVTQSSVQSNEYSLLTKKCCECKIYTLLNNTIVSCDSLRFLNSMLKKLEFFKVGT